MLREPREGVLNFNRDPVIPRNLKISLLPDPDGEDLGLYLDASEFQDVIQRHKNIRLGHFKLDADASAYLYGLTIGHVGMIKGLLEFFEIVSTIKSASGSTSFTYS